MEEIEKEIGEDGLLAQNEEMMADIMDESAEDSSIDAANDTPFPQEEHFEPHVAINFPWRSIWSAHPGKAAAPISATSSAIGPAGPTPSMMRR